MQCILKDIDTHTHTNGLTYCEQRQLGIGMITGVAASYVMQIVYILTSGTCSTFFNVNLVKFIKWTLKHLQIRATVVPTSIHVFMSSGCFKHVKFTTKGGTFFNLNPWLSLIDQYLDPEEFCSILVAVYFTGGCSNMGTPIQFLWIENK